MGGVADARRHMDFSRWDQYSVEEKQDLLARIGVEVRNRQLIAKLLEEIDDEEEEGEEEGHGEAGLVEGGDEADRQVVEFGKRYDKFSVYHTLVGVYYYRMNEMTKARQAFEEAIRLNQTNKTARAMLTLLDGKG